MENNMSLDRKDTPYISSHQLIEGLLDVEDPEYLELIKSKQPIEAKQAEIDDVSRHEELYYSTAEFACAVLWPEKKLYKNYRAILAIDVDDTIIDEAESLKAQKPVFIHKEKLKQRIQYAVEHNILVVVVTT